ncbi:hypothetical protein FRC09_000691 [Ceratobasidium sp. 395]|nr:hypothetical protein FRC09_000691 [Ceratobasidium sp. 395]
MHTSASSVFNNSVLLDTICDHSANKELLCAMRTSRLGFNTAAPRVWKHLKDVQPLLMLLAPVLKLSSVKKPNDTMKVTLPTFSPGIFTRFNCYSTFVRKLVVSCTWNISSSRSVSLQLQPWSTLSCWVRHTPLLPNLESFKVSGYSSDENEVILWISTFVSPSVKTVDVRIPRSVVGQLSTAAVLGLLTQKAPKLERVSHNLKIMPSKSDNTPPRKSAASQLALSALTCGHLQNFQYLTGLSISGLFIDSAIFFELSCLPKLQQLAIAHAMQRNENFAKIFRDIQLPPRSFPSLQTFQLDSAYLDDIVAIWKVTPLVLGLTKVTLQHITGDPSARIIYGDRTFFSILASMTTCSPHIKELALESTASLGNEPLTIDLANSPWILLVCLSISRLRLGHFRVDAVSLKNVQQVWPRLVVLEIPEQELTLQHLAYLAQLPELKKISAARFEDMEQIPELQDCGTSSPLQAIEFVGVLRDQIKIKSSENVARFLLGLCPEFRGIVYSSKPENAPQPNLELLNTHIRVIQGVAKTKKMISTRYGPDAIQLLLDESLASFY